MIAAQLPLFAPGWEVEPCADADDPPARRRLRAARARCMGPRWDYGRSAARSDALGAQPVHTVTVRGEWL